ncbi:Agglutinin [Sesamum alatum]|uniref:Agglutinin n=1 Tax=Sesamum alatum TaxID=300844 RepID=A0AAE2CP07_9LAMI|nr:Agglutinin [Sesamum alatum]
MSENEISSCEGEICIGGWGSGRRSESGQQPQKWSYKPKDGIITQIIVSHRNDVISSIRFVDGSMEYSPLFGSTASANDRTLQININHPAEYLIGVSGDVSTDVIRALRFQTNVNLYCWPERSFYYKSRNFEMEGGKIVGFHGHATSSTLNSIGVYVKAISSLSAALQVDDIFKDSVARYPGPWGGCGGKHWDDGVFSAVKRIHIYFTASRAGIQAIKFQYLRRDGTFIRSPTHGAGAEFDRVVIKIDSDDEFLIGVAGFCGRVKGNKLKGNGGMEVINSLTFYTNKETYGPYGDENGNYFTSMACGNAKVVGFQGSSGTYLNAIGVHLEYV